MSKKDQDLENARIKYSSAINLKNAEGEIQWSRYNAMLLVNTIFLGFIGNIYNDAFNFPKFFYNIFLLIPLLGLVLCWAWLKMTFRGFYWSEFWIGEARKLERQIKGKINPVIKGRRKRDEMGKGTTKKASYIVIGIFAFIYLYIFFGFVN